MQAIRLKRQVREQRFEIWEKSANIEKQTSDAQTSDRKPLRLPFRLKELRTFACFPISPQRGINYPPPAFGWRSAWPQTGPPCIENSGEFPVLRNCGQWREYFLFIPERSCVLQAFLFLAFVFLSFIKKNSSSLLQFHWIARPRESVRILAEQGQSLVLAGY